MQAEERDKEVKAMDMEENPATTYVENPYRGIFILHRLRGNQ